MSTPSIKTKLLAVFVTVFICLNAGGAVCVAYCRTAGGLVEQAHCPLKRTADHCKRSKTDAHDSVVSNKLECCSITLTFFGGPIEKFSFSIVPADRPTAIAHHLYFDKVLIEDTVAAHPYRGPPPIDRRVERIKNCILRI